VAHLELLFERLTLELSTGTAVHLERIVRS
jgi:hypothetical protein